MAATALNHAMGVWPAAGLVLGQSTQTVQTSHDILFALGLLTAAAAAIVIIGLVVWKKLGDPIESSDAGAVFDLSELRRLHREGQLSDEEFQAAKAAAILDGTAAFLPKETPEQPTAADEIPIEDDNASLGPELLDDPDQSPE